MGYGKCDFCGSEDVVLIAGYRYCPIHSRKLDRTFIYSTLTDAFPSMTLAHIKDICREMFGTDDYGYSTFPKLYVILNRGEWIEKKKQFAVPIDSYLINVFNRFLEINYPKIWESTLHESRIPIVW